MKASDADDGLDNTAAQQLSKLDVVCSDPERSVAC